MISAFRLTENGRIHIRRKNEAGGLDSYCGRATPRSEEEILQNRRFPSLAAFTKDPEHCKRCVQVRASAPVGKILQEEQEAEAEVATEAPVSNGVIEIESLHTAGARFQSGKPVVLEFATPQDVIDAGMELINLGLEKAREEV